MRKGLLNSHSNLLPFVPEVQLGIYLDLLSLKIKGSGRIPAELFLIGETLETKEFARSEQLRDR
jgi:hypothetical protein